MATIKDVALRAGVSTATVSRVLAGFQYLSPDVKERVLQAVSELDYRPNHVARSLRVRSSSIIALIVADIQNSFFSSVGRAVEDVAYSLGMTTFLCNTDEDPEKEDYYLRTVATENVAGIIIAPTSQLAGNVESLNKRNLPMVIIDRELPALHADTVVIDNIRASAQAVEHLHQAGKRRIAGIFGSGGQTGVLRREGYRSTLKQLGLCTDSELCITTKPREEEGYEAARRLLALENPPDALFASNSLLAAGAFSALKDSGISIPDQLAFVTFDEARWTRLVSPAVTVVRQPTYEIGRLAMELMADRIADPERPLRKVILETSLIVRGSSLGSDLD